MQPELGQAIRTWVVARRKKSAESEGKGCSEVRNLGINAGRA